jgi:hypothetical protein
LGAFWPATAILFAGGIVARPETVKFFGTIAAAMLFGACGAAARGYHRILAHR